MPRRSSGGGGIKLPESLQICIAPTRRRLQHQRHHSSLREERKASFRSSNWIRKEKCKVSLPTLKVSVLQPVKNSIVDKLKGAWSRMKLVAVSFKKTVPAAGTTSQKKPAAVLMSHQGVAALGGYTQLNSTYPEDAVADCIQFIKQSSVEL